MIHVLLFSVNDQFPIAGGGNGAGGLAVVVGTGATVVVGTGGLTVVDDAGATVVVGTDGLAVVELVIGASVVVDVVELVVETVVDVEAISDVDGDTVVVVFLFSSISVVGVGKECVVEASGIDSGSAFSETTFICKQKLKCN